MFTKEYTESEIKQAIKEGYKFMQELYEDNNNFDAEVEMTEDGIDIYTSMENHVGNLIKYAESKGFDFE